MRTWSHVAFAGFCLAAAAAAQQLVTSDGPKFEVVSIREVPRNAPPLLRDPDASSVLPGGQYTDPRVTLGSMIVFAYGIRSYLQLQGLPAWAQDGSFAVTARPPADFPALSPSANREQVRLMMRSMLADRFHLRLHTETRQERIMKLEVAKGGIKIKEVDPPVPPAKEGRVNAAVGDRDGRMIGNKATMSGMVAALVIFLKRPVTDATGLTGYYDFDIKWSAPDVADGRPATPGLGAEGIGLLVSVLQSQFGLRLSSAIGPVEHWIVDQVEPPSAN